jgi:predicted nucleic acid-binding protein
MIANAFLDANVLIYANSKAPQDREKSVRARQIMLAAPFALSTQVLQEFIANALRRKALGITEANIDATLELASHASVAPVTLEIVLTAVSLRRRYQISHWDATIIAAAQALGCTTLYSEDLNHGQDYGGVRVVNPFFEL